jgi:acyl-CoA synthetase (NDP forming)
VADACGLAGFETPPLDAATALSLAQILDGDATLLGRNPVDVTLTGAKPDLLKQSIAALLASPRVDAAIVIVGSSALFQPERIASAIASGLHAGDKPLLAYVSPHAPKILAMLNAAGLPSFTAPESCAAALAALHRAILPIAAPAPVPASARQVALPTVAGPLNEYEAKRLFEAFGIASVREAAAATPAEAQAAALRLGERVVLKVLARTIAHKTEAGGVRLDVPSSDVASQCEAMRQAVQSNTGAAAEGFLVQERVPEGVELILGFHRDPQLGPLVLLGLGGIATEIYEDTSIRLLPLARADAEAMTTELRAHRLLTGFRGRPAADVAALVQAILAFASMAAQLGDRLVEAEINPLFVLPQGQGVRAADGMAVLA